MADRFKDYGLSSAPPVRVSPELVGRILGNGVESTIEELNDCAVWAASRAADALTRLHAAPLSSIQFIPFTPEDEWIWKKHKKPMVRVEETNLVTEALFSFKPDRRDLIVPIVVAPNKSCSCASDISAPNIPGL